MTNVRDAAAPLLRKEIADQLRSGSPVEYQLALRKLELLRPDVVITKGIAVGLCSGLRSRDRWLRERTASAVAKVPTRRCLGALIECLSDRHPAVRDYACQALGAIRDPAAIPGLTRMLADRDEQVRHSALHALTTLRRSDIKLIARMLQDRSALVRLAAASALGRTDAPGTEVLIRRHLKAERDGLVRCDLLEALYLKERTPTILAHLLKLGRSGRGLVRLRVYDVLAGISNRDNAHAILLFLRSQEPHESSRVGRNIIRSMERKIRKCVARWGQQPAHVVGRDTRRRTRRRRASRATSSPVAGTAYD